MTKYLKSWAPDFWPPLFHKSLSISIRPPLPLRCIRQCGVRLRAEFSHPYFNRIQHYVIKTRSQSLCQVCQRIRVRLLAVFCSPESFILQISPRKHNYLQDNFSSDLSFTNHEEIGFMKLCEFVQLFVFSRWFSAVRDTAESVWRLIINHLSLCT